jgi:hypothetical protein
MKNPYGPPPLDPPPTKSELVWWESYRYDMRVKVKIASFTAFGLFGLALGSSTHGWRGLVSHPFLSLWLFVFEGAIMTFLTTPFRHAYERQVMPIAIRTRRVRSALLARPPA